MNMISEQLETISLYDLDNSIDYLIEFFRKLKDKYADKVLRLNLCDKKYDDGKEYAVMWDRPENEKEIKLRQDREQSNKEYRKRLYEEYKKEFGE